MTQTYILRFISLRHLRAFMNIIEKLDRVSIGVEDNKELDEAINFFSDLGVEFDRLDRAAISPIGLELVAYPKTHSDFQTGLRAFHLKVSDYEEAKTTMRKKGIEPYREVEFGGLKQAFYKPKILKGARLILVDYKSIHPAVIARKSGN